MKYVKRLPLYQTKSKSLIVDVLSSGILPSITDAGIKIWKEYKSSVEKRKEEIKRQLDNLKWKDFGKI